MKTPTFILNKKMRTAVSMLVLPALLAACGKSEWREVKAPNTGDVAFEAQHGDLTPQTIQPEQTAYVTPERVRTRTTPDQDPSESTEVLDRGTPVQIVTAQPIGEEQVVEVRTPEEFETILTEPPAKTSPAPTQTPVQTAATTAPIVKKSVLSAPVLEKAKPAVKTEVKPAVKAAPKAVAVKEINPVTKPVVVAKATKMKKKSVYVPLKYLQKKPVVLTQDQADADRFIMIQNIASGKLRVYIRSEVTGGPNKLVLETDMINGENEPQTTRRTAVGSYRIEKWVKFYQANNGLAPSWYDPKLETDTDGYSSLPLPGSEIEDWVQSYLLPKDKNGQPTGYVRGGFGWYTAKIGPNAHAQWTHGTLGWGGDGDRFIKNVSNFKLKEFYGDPRTFGCTRVENQAIAFIQNFLPVGTRVIKVYAKETVADASLERYKNEAPVQTWDWILSKDQVREVNPRSSWKSLQLGRKLEMKDILEEGTYEMDAHPDAVQFEKEIQSPSGQTKTTMVTMEANVYNLPKKSFHGEFLVDEGRFVNYKHPSELRTGGYADLTLPGVVTKK